MREWREENSNKDSFHTMVAQFFWREIRVHVFRVFGACLIIDSNAAPTAVDMLVPGKGEKR